VVFSQIVLVLLALSYMFSGIFARAAYSWQRSRKAALRPMSPDAGILGEAENPGRPTNR